MLVKEPKQTLLSSLSSVLSAMFSFVKLVSVAVLALGVFAAAVPAQERTAESSAVTVGNILNSLNDKIAPMAAKFASLDSSTAPGDAMAVITSTVKSMANEISSAREEIASLNVPAGSLDAIFAVVPLSKVLTTVLVPAGGLLSNAGPGMSRDAVLGAVNPLGGVLGDLLALVLELLAGPLAIVQSVLVLLLALVIPVITALGLLPLLAILGL